MYNVHKQGKVWELSLVKVMHIYIHMCRTAFICKETYLNHSEQTNTKITSGMSHEKVRPF